METIEHLSNENFELLTSVAGKQAANLALDLMTEESKQRYRSFYPCGDLLIGLRYHEPKPDSKGFKAGRQFKIIEGKIVIYCFR